MRKNLYQLLFQKKNIIVGIGREEQLLLLLFAQIGIYVEAFYADNEDTTVRILNKRILPFAQIKDKDECNYILYCRDDSEEIKKKKLLNRMGLSNVIAIHDFDIDASEIWLSASLLNRVVSESRELTLIAYGLSNKIVKFCRLLEMLDIRIDCFLTSDKKDLDIYEKIFDYPVEIKDIYDVLYLKKGSYRIFTPNRSVFDKLAKLGLREGVDYSDIEHNHRYVDNPKVLDPILGYNWQSNTCDVPGFVLYGKEDSKYRIVALGGSTSDSMFDPYYSWPKQLYEKLKTTYDICIYSGGCEGYKSSQELMKFIRDVLPLKPDLVIDYSGHNDGFISTTVNEGLKDNAFYNYFQITLIKAFSEQKQLAHKGHSLSTKAGYVLGNVLKCERVETYLRNIRIMHTVSNLFGIKYICFLQPCLIRKRKYWGTREKEMFLCSDCGEFYFEAINKFYDELSGTFNEYFIDASHILDHYEKSLNDECHATKEGNNIVSNYIYSYVENELVKHSL